MNPCRGEQTHRVRLGSLGADVRQMVQTTGEMMETDVEEQGRDGGVAVDMDHAQEVGQVAFSGAHEEQPLETQTESRDDGVYWLTDDDEQDLIVTDLFSFPWWIISSYPSILLCPLPRHFKCLTCNTSTPHSFTVTPVSLVRTFIPSCYLPGLSSTCFLWQR